MAVGPPRGLTGRVGRVAQRSEPLFTTGWWSYIGVRHRDGIRWRCKVAVRHGQVEVKTLPWGKRWVLLPGPVETYGTERARLLVLEFPIDEIRLYPAWNLFQPLGLALHDAGFDVRPRTTERA